MLERTKLQHVCAFSYGQLRTSGFSLVRRQIHCKHGRQFSGRSGWTWGCVPSDQEGAYWEVQEYNPFIEDHFLDTFHLPKFMDGVTVLHLLQRLGNELDLAQRKAQLCRAPLLQILVALWFYTTSSFLHVDGDLFGTYISTVSRIVARVSRKIAALRPDFIQFPHRNKVLALQDELHALGGIPGIVGAIDCVHIAVWSPGGDQAQLFVNSKRYFSINVHEIGD